VFPKLAILFHGITKHTFINCIGIMKKDAKATVPILLMWVIFKANPTSACPTAYSSELK